MLTVAASAKAASFHDSKTIAAAQVTIYPSGKKIVLNAHDEALRGGRTPVLDVEFIEQHTRGFEALAADLNKSVARAPRVEWASENIKTSGRSRQER